VLKVDRPCHRAAVTSQFDPKQTSFEQPASLPT
jgi:hypothetical protein